MRVPGHLMAQVRQRAEERCEYCRMSQRLQGAAFHIEHILRIVLGGETCLDNLALACPSCNLHKADRIAAVDPATGRQARLFHPREDLWEDHFRWSGVRLMGTSDKGRATLTILRLNHPRRILIRKAETRFGLFPPG